MPNTKRGFGGVGIIIIILLALGVGAYFWSQKKSVTIPANVSTAVDLTSGTNPIGTNLSVFAKIKYARPQSCWGPGCSVNDKFWIDNPPVAAIEENYGVVVLNTNPANTAIDQYLILIGDINSQPKQLNDVSVNVSKGYREATVKDIQMSDGLVTVNVKLSPYLSLDGQTNKTPEKTIILHYQIVGGKLVAITGK